MRDLISPAGILALGLLAAPALAQETSETPAPEAPAAEAPAAEQPAPAPAAPQPTQPEAYVKETYQDWNVVCIKLSEEREDCAMRQMLEDNGNPVSEVTIAPLPASVREGAAGVTIAMPLETLLSANLTVRVDDGPKKVYPFTFCQPQACYSRFGLTAEEIAAFKAGNKATVSIVPLAAPDKTVDVTMSLSGFTAAFDAVTAE